MAIIKGATTINASEEEVVYSEDPDVTPDAAHRGCGWIPRANAQVRTGADIVTIKALPPAEASRYADAEATLGKRSAAHFAAQRSVQKANGAKGSKCLEWIDRLAQQDGETLERLGDRIMRLTRGQPMEPLYASVRKALRVEVVDDDPAAKSIGS